MQHSQLVEPLKLLEVVSEELERIEVVLDSISEAVEGKLDYEVEKREKRMKVEELAGRLEASFRCLVDCPKPYSCLAQQPRLVVRVGGDVCGLKINSEIQRFFNPTTSFDSAQ